MRRVLLLLAAVVVVALPACNAIVGFNPEDQPCNPQATTGEEKCLAGYVCEGGKCRKGTLPPGDAGTDDAGTP
ncbi:MAG: hypothetical protein AB1730_26345 [Myxococcota bacterium]|jgi:hypothetical protein